jgi:MFS family permease
MRVPEAMRPLIRVWSHRNYAWFMGGMTPSLITLWMQKIGTMWLAWELTHTNTWVGIIAAADYAPMLVMAPFVGAFVDRANPVTVQKITQWLNLALSATMATLVFAGLMNIWLLAALSLLLGCLHPFNAISRHSIVPATVPKAEIPTALACDSALYNAARFVGPALAGLVILFFGVGFTFASNSLGCACYLFGLYAMHLAPPEHKARAHGTGMLSDIKEGMAYVRRHAGIGPLFLLMTIGAVWIRPLQDLLPGFSGDVFNAGPQGLGWLTAGMGVGAMIAATMIAMYGRTSGLTTMVLLAFLANMVATFGFVATSNLWVSIVVGTFWGGTLTLMSTGTQALVQSAVDNHIRARVMSLYTMIYRGAPFLGALIIGVMADYIGLRLAFAIAVTLCVVPWLVTYARNGSMTLALEGRHNDLDQRVVSAARGWAGLQYERIVDLRHGTGVAGLAGRVRDLSGRAKRLASRVREQSVARLRRTTGEQSPPTPPNAAQRAAGASVWLRRVRGGSYKDGGSGGD